MTETDDERMERERLEALSRASDLPFDVKVCPLCKKLRAIPKGRENCPRCRKGLTADDLTRMNVPQEFWRVNFAGVTPSVHDVAVNFLKGLPEYFANGAGMWLYGPPGAGKTGTACLLLKSCRERFRSGYFIRAGELREAMRTQQDFDAGESVVERIHSVDVLVLDSYNESDLTLPYLKLPDLMELVVERGQRQKVTLITSNLTPTMLSKHRTDFFDAVGTYLIRVKVDGENRRASRANELSEKLLTKSSSVVEKSAPEKQAGAKNGSKRGKK